MRRLVFVLSCAVALAPLAMVPLPLRADAVATLPALVTALQFDKAAAILRDEGIQSGKDLGADLSSAAGSDGWNAALDKVYDVPAMVQVFDRVLAKELSGQPEVVEKSIAFFGSTEGARLIGLELAARKAIADEAVKEAASLAYAQLADENPARQAQIDRFVAANDLIESNVMGGLNASLAFMRGMAAENPDAFGLSEADMLAQVRSGEEEARADTAAWLYPYIALSYQPLTDEEFERYVAFSESDAGRALNSAMFRAFDVMFEDISTQLGRAFARQLQGQDI